jgi:hypothetical protein
MSAEQLAFWIGVMVLGFLALLALQFVGLAGQVLRLVLLEAYPALDRRGVAQTLREALGGAPQREAAVWLRTHHGPTLARLRGSRWGMRGALLALAVLVVTGRLSGLV